MTGAAVDREDSVARFALDQLPILEGIALGRSLPALLEQIVLLVEAQAPAMLCSLLLLDRVNGRVLHGAAPHLPKTYVDAINGAPIGPIAGSCGTAAWRGERVIVEDIETDPLWADYKSLALVHGLRACWSSPIFSPSHEVLGTFAIYYQERRRPNEREVRWVDAATHLASIAITRDAAESALRTSEARYRRIVDTTYEAVLMFDATGRTTFANWRAATLLGYPREEIVGKHFSAFVHDDDRARIEELFARRLHGEGSQDEVRVRQQSGAERWVIASSNPIEDGSGNIVGALAMLTDITVRRKAEEERSQLIFDLGERVKELSLMHRLARLFQTDARVTDTFLAEVAALVPSGFQHSDRCAARVAWHGLEGKTANFAPSARSLSTPFTSGGRTGVVEVVYPEGREGGEGAFFLAEERVLLVTLAEMIGGHLDRRWSEAALRESELQNAVIFDGAVIGLALVEDTGRILRCNRAFQALLGYGQEELCAMTFAEFTHPEDLDADLALYEEVLARKRDIYELVKRYIRKDARIVWVRLIVSAVRDARGELRHAVAMVENITEQKQAAAERAQLENQLQQAQKMQSLGTLAGGIAHDFNNILTAISGNVDVARRSLPARDSVHEYLEDIAAASRRASDLVRRILTFSRREESRRERIALAPVVEEAVKLLSASAGPSRARIRTHVSHGDALVLADASQIHQVIMNLATNAVHATSRGGHVDVELDLVYVDEESARQTPDLKPGEHVRLVVRDDGPGMTEDTASRIFEPFFTTKPAGEGTGLGLSVVHGIVKNHNGAIVVRTKPGKGSTFEVYLPLAPELPAATSANGAARTVEARPETPAARATDASGPASDALRGNGETVLYVDDERSLIVLAERLFERLGYRIAGFTNPCEALEAFTKKPHAFDALVTDLTMREMSGLELTDAVRAIRPDIPVVLVSGHFGPEIATAAQGRGSVDTVHKPDTLEPLSRVLHERLREARERKLLPKRENSIDDTSGSS